MTFPVLTSVVPGAEPFHSSPYTVFFYLPAKFQASPPVPLTELHLRSDAWSSRCVAVRKFSGVAREGSITKEMEQLALSLSRSPWANSTSSKSKFAYSIAQYDSPLRLIGRTNEVWVDVDASGSEGCASGSGGMATY
ncbi:hypothetical protein MLD38_027922 [Melastoma candidum]|nr:hypothetical protein MLD38_027922 [Melastoma candidum]